MRPRIPARPILASKCMAPDFLEVVVDEGEVEEPLPEGLEVGLEPPLVLPPVVEPPGVLDVPVAEGTLVETTVPAVFVLFARQPVLPVRTVTGEEY